MSELRLHVFEDRPALDEALALALEERLGEAIGARGAASLALSGGSTPRPLLTRLAQAKLPWERVSVTLVDDRWVDPQHEDSNERMVHETLLQGPAAAARFVSLHSAAAHPREAMVDIEARLRVFDTFDCLMLGMGGDGHFASLFPGTAELQEGLDPASKHACIAVDPLTAPHARMSMTLARIVDTRSLILHLTGVEKRAVFERARVDRDPGVLPIAAVLDIPAPPLEVYWAP